MTIRTRECIECCEPFPCRCMGDYDGPSTADQFGPPTHDICPIDGEQRITGFSDTGGSDPTEAAHLTCGHRVASFGPGEPPVIVGGRQSHRRQGSPAPALAPRPSDCKPGVGRVSRPTGPPKEPAMPVTPRKASDHLAFYKSCEKRVHEALATSNHDLLMEASRDWHRYAAANPGAYAVSITQR